MGGVILNNQGTKHMTTLTYTITVTLPADEFLKGALVAKCAPLADRLATMLQEADIEGTVTHSFDGRKARVPKTTPASNGEVSAASLTTGAGSFDLGAARGAE